MIPISKKTLVAMAKTNDLKHLPLTVFKGKAGPEGYKINKDSGVTLVMWNKSKVVHAKAYATGDFCDQCAGSQVATFEKKIAAAPGS